jgi:hypothetical protein
MSSEFKFADTVWHRVVNIVQESMLTGVDCADLLRQMRVQPDAADPSVLVLTPAYEAQVRATHAKLLQQAKELQEQHGGDRFIVPNGNANN